MILELKNVRDFKIHKYLHYQRHGGLKTYNIYVSDIFRWSVVNRFMEP